MLLEPHVDHHAAHAVGGDRVHERRVLHAVVAAERRHHAAQALRPVARPERLAVERDALDDELDDLGGSSAMFVHYSEALVAKPVSRILVINDEHLVLREFVKGLNAAARALDNPLGISFGGVATAKEALAAIESDGDLQAVLVDDTLYTLSPRTATTRRRSCRCRPWSWCSASRACGPSSTSTS